MQIQVFKELSKEILAYLNFQYNIAKHLEDDYSKSLTVSEFMDWLDERIQTDDLLREHILNLVWEDLYYRLEAKVAQEQD